MAFGIDDFLFAAAAAAVSTGISAATAPRAPNAPDPARSSRRAVMADLSTLPGRRQVEALARLGRAGTYQTGAPEYFFNGRWMSAANLPDVVNRRELPQRPGTATADFTGLGDADVQGRLARGMAENELELSRKYGAQFIDEARRQQALADPEGTEARSLLASEINRIANTERERPVAGALDAQMLEELRAGRNMTADTAEMVEAVRARRAGAGDAPGVDLATELNEGPAGEERRRSRLHRSMAHLSSGQTPEDLQYRDSQQDLANMAAFLGGRTPQSQFGANRNAQQGATPVAQAAPLPGQNPNAAGLFQQADVGAFGQQVNAQRGQVSPWFAGLSTLLQGANVAGQAGWQPMRR